MDCMKCGACCIALSISSPLPGMPEGKPAGIRCFNLTNDNRCKIYTLRPVVCCEYSPTVELCASSFKEAMNNIQLLEEQTM